MNAKRNDRTDAKTQANETTISRGGTLAGIGRFLGNLALLAGATGALADDHANARFRGTGKADPIRITDVRRVDGPAAGQSSIALDLAWDHSWRAAWDVSAEQHGGTGALKIESWDAAWVFFKVRADDKSGWPRTSW